jgi:hypothetical protein
MRRYMTAVCVVGLLGAGAGVALAATPAPHTYYSGFGGNYQNQGGSWSRHGTANFHLTTSGKYYYGVRKYYVEIRSFRGSYTTSCNGTHPVSATWLKVKANGTFNFSFVSHGAHVRIWGDFTSRNRAHVNYLVNFSGTGTNPSTVNSSCATWVHGTATS